MYQTLVLIYLIICVFTFHVESFGLHALAMQDAFYKAKDMKDVKIHQLQVRSTPGIRNVRSNMYEVRMNSYPFDSPMANAVVIMMSGMEGEGGPEGRLMLSQMPDGPLMIMGNLTGLDKGMYSLFVHEFGDMREGCKSTGTMYEPYMMPMYDRMNPMNMVSHLGDFKAADEGMTMVQMMAPWKSMPLTLMGGSRMSIGGRTLALYHSNDENKDMMMVGCGLIGLV